MQIVLESKTFCHRAGRRQQLKSSPTEPKPIDFLKAA